MKIVVAAICLAVLSGCSIIAPKVGPSVAKAVNRYCVESYQTRLLMRTEVNALIKPNSIKVSCEGDPE